MSTKISRTLLILAFLCVWASGVNMATHHWSDALGNLLITALLLSARAINWQLILSPER